MPPTQANDPFDIESPQKLVTVTAAAVSFPSSDLLARLSLSGDPDLAKLAKELPAAATRFGLVLLRAFVKLDGEKQRKFRRELRKGLPAMGAPPPSARTSELISGLARAGFVYAEGVWRHAGGQEFTAADLEQKPLLVEATLSGMTTMVPFAPAHPLPGFKVETDGEKPGEDPQLETGQPELETAPTGEDLQVPNPGTSGSSASNEAAKAEESPQDLQQPTAQAPVEHALATCEISVPAPTTEPLTLPAGQRFATPGGELFITTGHAVIATGAAAAQVEARHLLGGTRGNVPAAAITNPLHPPAWAQRLSVTNPAPAAGGDGDTSTRVVSSDGPLEDLADLCVAAIARTGAPLGVGDVLEFLTVTAAAVFRDGEGEKGRLIPGGTAKRLVGRALRSVTRDNDACTGEPKLKMANSKTWELADA